jgi:hypothetical protein
MWISKQKYTEMVDKTARAETRSEWLLTQINLLQTELGTLKHSVTGQPVAIPQFRREATDHSKNDPAETSFEDVGDDVALKLGL